MQAHHRVPPSAARMRKTTPPTLPTTSIRHPSRRAVWLERAALATVGNSHNETADDQTKPMTAVSKPTTTQTHHTKTHHAHRMPEGTGTPVLSERDEGIVYTVAQFHFLTAEQVTRLFYHHGSLEYVRAKLKRLTEARYLLRLRLPRATRGNAPWVYRVAPHGLRLLAAAGTRDPLVRLRPAEQHEKSYLFLTHTLAVNDFLIAALLLPRSVPQLKLAGWQHERELRRSPVRLTSAQGEVHTVIPDAWLDFHLYARVRMSLLLELDRGTIEQWAFTRKLRGLLAFAAGPYAATFGTPSLTVVFATTAGTDRARQIVRWCEQELRARHQEADASLFLIGSLPPGIVEPFSVFLEPRWYEPFATTSVPLLDLSAAARMAS